MNRPLAILLALVVGCDPSDRGPKWRPGGHTTPQRGGDLRFATKDQIKTLDPSVAGDEVSSFILHPLFDTLLDYKMASLEIEPRLADTWSTSADGLIYTFHLRDNIAYADGRPIVAADFKFSLERALRMADSPYGPALVDVAGAADVVAGRTTDCTGIETHGDATLVIRLAHPNVAFKYILTMTFTTPQRADHVAAAGDQIRRRTLASGPYMLASWDEGDRLVLARNPHYVIPNRGYLDTITMRENIPRDTQFLMFERGELDTVDRLSAPDLVWIMTQPAWKPYIHQQAMMNVYGSRMNVTVPPFDDVRVRRALNYALDKAHSVRLLNGTAVASHGLLSPNMLGRDATIAPYPHDVAKACALLAEAGYPHGFDVDYVLASDEEGEKLAESLQGDLAEVGVRVHLRLMSFATYLTAISKPDGAAFSTGTWLGDYPDPTDFFDVRFHSRNIATENSNNDTFYRNPELDALLDDAKRETDVDKRVAMYHRVERILYDDAPWIWNYHQLMTEVVQPYVRDSGPHPIWSRDYTSAWFDLGKNGKPVPR